MLKKIILLISATIAASSVAYANPAPYVGASLGIINNYGEFKINGTTVNNVSSTYRGVPFNVFVGFGGVVSESFYLAGELTGTITSAQITDAGITKTTYGLGASILPGVMLSDHTLAFARVGAVRTHFSQLNDNRNGAEVGVGLQTSLTQNVDLRGEYDYVAYRSIDATDFMGNKITFSPRSDQFTLGLVYKFD